MRFRPCIDIHNARVKQIVGSTLADMGQDKTGLKENFVSQKSAEDFARLYKKDDLKGGHIIILNSADSPYYKESKNEALKALGAYPKGLQIGGGINASNASDFLKAGASHLIVTSFVFKDGKINYDNLNLLKQEVGKDHLVLDLSCRIKGDDYYIVSDRWQTFTSTVVNTETLASLGEHCDEFLIHAVDAEGKQAGIDEGLIRILSAYKGVQVTYAGGISTYDDIKKLGQISGAGLDFTVGSALDLFGGSLSYEKIVKDYS